MQDIQRFCFRIGFRRQQWLTWFLALNSLALMLLYFGTAANGPTEADQTVESYIETPDWSNAIRLVDFKKVPDEQNSNLQCRAIYRRLPEVKICMSKSQNKDFINEQREAVFAVKIFFDNFPDLGIIDAGAKHGVFSVLAASMSRDVVAVENDTAFLASTALSLKLQSTAHPENLIYLLNNAISGDAENWEAEKSRDIQFYDMLEISQLRAAILKVDLDGEILKTYDGISDLFQAMVIPVVIMDWSDVTDVKHADNDQEVQDMIKFFKRSGFKPFSIQTQNDELTGDLLNENTWESWPDWIIWVLPAILQDPKM